jgi:hypothetical protein
MAQVESTFLDFVRLVIHGDIAEVSRRLAANPELARMASDGGATRQDAASYFFDDIKHYLYAGDTALHMAAAAFRQPVAELLIAHGADCRARNRRGAEPLHYAADANRRRSRRNAKRSRTSCRRAPTRTRRTTPESCHCTGPCARDRSPRWRRCSPPAPIPYGRPRRVDAAASRRPAHGSRRQRVRDRPRAAGGDHRGPARARREADRSRRQGQAGARGGDQPWVRTLVGGAAS